VASAIQLGRRPSALPRVRVAHRLAGAAALGYVIAAGVENMELLRAPGPGAGAADVRAAYADGALAAVTAAAGVLSLVLYAVFAASLAPGLRRPRAALASGLAGAALALAGIVAAAPLVLDGGAGMTGEAVVSAAELQRTLRQLAGPCMALFLLCAAAAVPRPLARAAPAIALPLALAPVAGHVPAAIAFSLHALWIWLAALWLLFGGVPMAALVRRSAFLLLVVAAGAVGAALLIVPDATGSFFAWGLRPAPLAAFAGGVYVGSAAVYAAGLRAPWGEARALVAAAVVLSVSVLAVTLAHLDVFDLGRLQAWAWLALFAAFAVTTCGLLIAGGRPARRGVPLPRPARAALALAGIALGGIGIRLWIDPGALPDLGGRFAGCWAVMLGFLAAWAAVVNRRAEARLPALALVALPGGALAGAARTLDGDPAHLAGLALLLACGAGVLRAARAD
jgi:hypothetical protein